MPQNSRRQASFSRLAAGQVTSRRSDIMLAATDTFCNLSRPDKLQVDQFRELFYSLISETDESAKRLIASALSKHYYAPRQILLYLALEEAAIAAPVLAYSKSLGQFDLLQIIDKTSNLHHRVIANRDDLGKTVIGKLVELDDYLVIRRLEDNSAVESTYLVSSKSSVEDVMDIPATTAASKTQSIAKALEEMDAILKGSKVREPLSLDTSKIDPEQTEIAPSGELSGAKNNKIKLAMDELVSLANRGGRLGSVEDLLSDLPAKQDISFSEKLLAATIRKNRQEQTATIQRELNLSVASVHSVFQDRSGDTMSVCLKAANVDAKTALQIITLSILNVGLSTHNTQRISKIYPALNQQACMDTVKTWSSSSASEPPVYVPMTVDDNADKSRGDEVKAPVRRTMPNTGNRKLFGT